MIPAIIHAHGAPALHQIVIAVALAFCLACALGFLIISRAIRRHRNRGAAALRRRYQAIEADDIDGRAHVLTVESAERLGILCRPIADSHGMTCATCGLGPCIDRTVAERSPRRFGKQDRGALS